MTGFDSKGIVVACPFTKLSSSVIAGSISGGVAGWDGEESDSTGTVTSFSDPVEIFSLPLVAEAFLDFVERGTAIAMITMSKTAMDPIQIISFLLLVCCRIGRFL